MKLTTSTASCVKIFALSLLLAGSVTAQAASDNAPTDRGYVDSVYNWGAWELGLEPAAGGPISLPDTAISNRPANVRFRPNDNSVFGVGNRGLATAGANPSPAPNRAPPTAGPSNVPAPHGGPGDRFPR